MTTHPSVRPCDVLVTGANGALGAAVIRELRLRGKTVLGSARTDGRGDATWDVTSAHGPSPPIMPYTLVHTAARRAPIDANKRDELLWDVNVGGTARVVEWALSRGVKRIVLASGAIVYGEWASPRLEDDEPDAARAGYYALSKWAAERIASTACQSRCGLTILRFSSLYGAAYKTGLIRHFLGQARTDGTIRIDPPFDDAFDLLHLEDAAVTIANAVDYDRCALWNVGGGEVTSLRDMAQVCARIAGATVEQSRRKARRKSRILNWVNDSRARREIGHSNTITLASGIEEIFLDNRAG